MPIDRLSADTVTLPALPAPNALVSMLEPPRVQVQHGDMISRWASIVQGCGNSLGSAATISGAETFLFICESPLDPHVTSGRTILS